MIPSFRPVYVAGLIGMLLIILKYRDTVYALGFRRLFVWISYRLGVSPRILPVRKTVRLTIDGNFWSFLEKLADYFLTIIVAFISFYSAYALSLKESADDQNQKSKELLQSAELRCTFLTAMLKKYTNTNSEGVLTTRLTDSEVVTNCCRNSVTQPFYITEVVATNHILSFLTLRGYEVLSVLEQNEQVAHNNLIDTSLSYFDRHMSFIAFMRFEQLRDTLIHSERNLLDSLTPGSLAKIESNICDENNALSRAANSRLYSQLKLEPDSNQSNQSDGLAESEFIVNDLNTDSLWRYSYLLVGDYKGRATIIANCFFVRKNGQLYLATAYEVLTSWKSWDVSKFGARINPYPDTLELRLFQNSTHRSIFFPIDISKIKRDAKSIRAQAEPDIYFYKLPDTSIQHKFEICTIDSLFSFDSYESKHASDLLIVGCPKTEFNSTRDYAQLRAEIFPSTVFGLYEQYIYYTDTPIRDSTNYMITLAPDKYLCGSPVFFEELLPEVDHYRKVLRFGGMYTGNDIRAPRGSAIRPEQIVRSFQRIK